jgi:hypothetical protein
VRTIDRPRAGSLAGVSENPQTTLPAIAKV